MPAETYSVGLPVEIGQIDRELKKLWAEGEGAMTRASHINLAVYSEEPGSLARNTEMLSQITENHACRAIVIGADPSTKQDRVEAWISAHCHISGSGAKRICSEQISFLLEGEMASEHPELAGKPTRIELRCAHMPDSRALELLGMIHDRLAFQEIKMEVVVAGE